MKKQKQKQIRILLIFITVPVLLLAIIIGSIIVSSKLSHDNPVEMEKAYCTLTDIIEISELSTLEYQYDGVVTKTNEKGEAQCHILYHATVNLGVDFNDIEFSRNEETHTYAVTLPKVKINGNLYKLNFPVPVLDFRFKFRNYLQNQRHEPIISADFGLIRRISTLYLRNFSANGHSYPIVAILLCSTEYLHIL